MQQLQLNVIPQACETSQSYPTNMQQLQLRLDSDSLICVLHQLPIHPRIFACAGRVSTQLRDAVEAAREELAARVCVTHRLRPNLSESAAHLLVKLVKSGQTAEALGLMVARASSDHPQVGGMRYGWSNWQDIDGATGLMEAAERDNGELVSLLIGLGAHLDIQDVGGWTALMLASERGHIEVAASLINAGAQLDLQNDEGWATATASQDGRDRFRGCTALMVACRSGHTEIAMALIDKGAKLDLQNEEGFTALMLASVVGYTDIALTLIEESTNLGLPVDQHDGEGCTALVVAGANGHTQIVQALKNQMLRQHEMQKHRNIYVILLGAALTAPVAVLFGVGAVLSFGFLHKSYALYQGLGLPA